MGLFNRIKNGSSDIQTAKSIVCPNCGASATNLENCEYCGSFLVRFTDQNISFDHDHYSEESTGDPSNYKIGEYLDFQLETARQPGIFGVGTQFSLGCGNAGEYTEDTLGFIMNGKYLSTFHINIVDPSAASRYQTKRYDIPFVGITDVDFVLVVLFVGFSSDINANQERSQSSRDIILHSQTQKKRFLKRCDFSKLMNHVSIDNQDYSFDLYYMNLGQDVKGAASTILQLAYNINDGFADYEILDIELKAFVDTF